MKDQSDNKKVPEIQKLKSHKSFATLGRAASSAAVQLPVVGNFRSFLKQKIKFLLLILNLTVQTKVPEIQDEVLEFEGQQTESLRKLNPSGLLRRKMMKFLLLNF